MSSDFQKTSLGRIINFANGRASPDRNDNASVPVFGSNGLIGFSKDSNSPANSIIIGRVGSYCGSVHFSKVRCWVTDNAIKATAINGNSSSFLYYLLRHLDLNRWRSGSGQPLINQTTLCAIEVDIPPLREQISISELMVDLDDRIALLRETNATLEAIAQALFKSWFVDFDPVYAKQQGISPAGMDDATAALFPDGFSAEGDLPNGWKMCPVREVVEGIYDGPHATPPEADDGPVFLGIKNLTGTTLDMSEIRHIAESDWQQWTRRVLPRAGDIVFSYEATLGYFALIPPNMRCCLGRRLALIRPAIKDGAGHFWFHQFVAEPFTRLLEKHTIQGATVNRIALKEFPSYAVLNPPLAVQLAFDRIVAPLWSRIHENQAQAQTLATLRDTLLPRLISGQLRLPEAQEQVAEVIA